jgi:hypothetical protein
MRFIETDADLASLVDYLRQHSPLSRLNNIEAHAVFTHLQQLGYRVQKPAAHPSGLRTTEEATTEVVPIGSGMNRRPATRR